MTPNYSNDPTLTESRRREERRIRRRRRALRRKLYGFTLALSAAIVAGTFILFTERTPEPPQEEPVRTVAAPTPLPEPEVVSAEPAVQWRTTEATQTIEAAFPSEYAILVDLDSGEVIAQKNADVSINPASMTKILTLLVAAEQISDTSGTYTMNFEITDYCYVNECSVVGYEVGEIIPVDELFYGCILNSGADACLALADIAAGSHENFVVLMNKKLEELGISDTAHFTNCVGLYDQDHSCTVGDMATILKAALKNEKAREVLSTKIFTTAPSNKHPAQDMSNWFIRRIEDQDTGAVDVLYAKTGYVSQSGFCAASGGTTSDGRTYLCVTGKSTSTWQSIYDHAELYQTYVEDPSTAAE